MLATVMKTNHKKEGGSEYPITDICMLVASCTFLFDGCKLMHTWTCRERFNQYQKKNNVHGKHAMEHAEELRTDQISDCDCDCGIG